MPRALPAYETRNIGGFNDLSVNKASVNNLFGGQDDFNFVNGFNNFNQQQQVIQVQEQNIQQVNFGGFQRQVVEQVNQVLVIDNQRNGFNNNLNNLFRQTNQRRNRGDVSTVIMVVMQVNVAIDDGRGNQIQQEVFAQSLIVANRGRGRTETVMLFEARTLVAQDIIGNGIGGGIGAGVGGNGFAGVSGAAALPTKTRGVQLLDARPTWTSVIEDSAATQGAIWQAEIEALQQAEQDAADNQLNNDLGAQEAEQKKQEAEQQKQEGEQQQNQEGEENKQEGEQQQNQDGEENKQEGEQQNAEQQQQQQQAEDAQKAADAQQAEQKKQE